MRAAPKGNLLPVRPKGNWVKISAVRRDPRGTNGGEPPSRVGGVAGSNLKNLLGDHLSPKMTILQAVNHPVPYLGVSCTNVPKKGSTWRPRLRLI